MEPSCSAVEEALQQVYNDAERRDAAQKWLVAVQSSAAAWGFSWELLVPEKPVEVQFFGASCLHQKILKFWHEVPQNQRSALLDKLLQTLGRLGGGFTIVTSKLCQALAGILLQTAGMQEENTLEEFIKTFNNLDAHSLTEGSRRQLLLEILRGIPDEFSSAAFGAKSGRRGMVKEQLLKDYKSAVLPLLVNALKGSTSPLIRNAAIRCARSWVQFGVSLPDIGRELLLCFFQCAHNDELSDEAIETLLAAFGSSDAHRFTSTVEPFLYHVLQLGPLWQAALNIDDMDRCRDIARFVTTVAETHVGLLLDIAASGSKDELRHVVSGIIDMILAFTGTRGTFPIDENVSDITFGFWYILQDTISSSELEKSSLYLPLFRPVYSKLAEILLLKAEYPDEQTLQTMSTEENESFRCYREDIRDTVAYAYCLLGEQLLSSLAVYLQLLVPCGGGDTSAPPPAAASSDAYSASWRRVESTLYLVASLSECVGVTEGESDVWLPQIFSLLPHVPLDCVHVANTTLQLIGAYADWYCTHPGQLRGVLSLAVSCLGRRETGAAATIALKEVTRANVDHVGGFAHDILTTSQIVLSTKMLPARDATRLMSCVGFVLSALPFPTICTWLDLLVTPELAELDRAAAAAASGPSQSATDGPGGVAAQRLAILETLQSLTWLFTSLDLKRGDSITLPTDVQPVLIIVRRILPTLELLLSRFMADEEIVESICELLKRSIMTLLDDFTAVLTDVCRLCAQLYQAAPHAVIFDLVKQLVILFGLSEQHSSNVTALLCALCQKTLGVLDADFRNQTDLLASFMSLLAQVVKKCPRLLADVSIDLDGLFRAAVLGTTLPEHPTVKASCTFLAEVIAKKAEYTHMDAVVNNHAPQLIDNVLRAVAGASPRANVENMSHVVLSLNQQYSHVLSQWLHSLMSQANYPLPSIVISHKDRFVKDVLKEVSNKQRLKETFVEFTLLCRGMSGSEYGIQTS